MKFTELLATVGELPVFRGSLLLAGDRDPADVRRQLSRWTAAGKVIQLRRDVYVLEYLHTASDNRSEWIARVRKISPAGVTVLGKSR